MYSQIKTDQSFIYKLIQSIDKARGPLLSGIKRRQTTFVDAGGSLVELAGNDKDYAHPRKDEPYKDEPYNDGSKFYIQ
ncbi:MAG: hypothetical protein DRI88_09115 [Bacteroidetes bacterium]|nr:MAG: hypothetical protein DRI88_09115 [Bacteroidota bacterium]